MRRDLKSRVAIATLLVLAAVSFTGGFLLFPSGIWGASPLVDIAAYGTPLAFMCAGVLVFCRPRLGYVLGVFGGLSALLWFILTDTSLVESSWVYLNATFSLTPDESEFPFAKLATLRIASGALISTAAIASLLRLLPARWLLGRLPLCQRTWPALAVGFLVMAGWFLHSVMPYRVPLIVDAAPAELRILHVEKHSLRFEETAESVYRNGRFFVNRSQRALFHFRWETRGVSGVMTTPTIHDRAIALVNSPELERLHTAPAKQLWSWNAEGWYVVLKDRRLLAFTSESRTPPPPEITDLFHEIEGLPGSDERSWAVHDVCLGFCYGPVAALGFQYSNQACFALAHGATQCR
jgi:hypothetical protein